MKQYLKEKLWITGILLSVVDCCGKRLYTNCNFPVKLLWFCSKLGKEYQAPRSCLPKIHWSLLQKKWSNKGLMTWKNPYVVEEAITRPIPKDKIDNVNEKDKLQVSKIKKYKSISNRWNKGIELDKSRSLDKSRTSQRVETEDTVKTLNKSRSISSASFSDKSTNI